VLAALLLAGEHVPVLLISPDNVVLLQVWVKLSVSPALALLGVVHDDKGSRGADDDDGPYSSGDDPYHRVACVRRDRVRGGHGGLVRRRWYGSVSDIEMGVDGRHLGLLQLAKEDGIFSHPLEASSKVR
jgi:hypothetical protein